MTVELVRTATSDGHRLDGALYAGDPASPRLCQLDAMLLLHGVGGNFYSGNLFDHLVGRLNARGLAVLRVNTRGHDAVSMASGTAGPVRHGSAYEIVDQCRFDVSAWVRILCERGFQQLGLLGHSLGAIKAIYSQAYQPESAIRAVIACSAPRLSHSAFMNSEAQPRFFESMTTAREFMGRKQPDALFQASFPFPILMTAAGYLDKYGPEERYNVLKFLDRVLCPLLMTYGGLEVERGGVAFAGMPEAVAERRRADQSLTTATISGADHIYSGVQEACFEAVWNWLVTTLPSAGPPPGGNS